MTPHYVKVEINPIVTDGIVVFNRYGTRFIISDKEILRLMNEEYVRKQGSSE